MSEVHVLKSKQKLSTPSHWPRAIVETLKEYNVDSKALFESIGMDYSRLQESEGFYLQDQVTELWNAATVITQDPLFGLKAGLKIQSTTYPSLGYALMASENFYACCQRMVRFQNILAEGLLLKLEKEEENYVLLLDIHGCEFAPSVQALDAMFSSFLSFIGWLTQKNVKPIKATLKRKQSLLDESFKHIFNCPIQYSEHRNALYFSQSQMYFPLATADETVAKIHDSNMIRLLEKNVKGDLVSRVRNLIIHKLPKGEPKQENIAELLNISVSTLKRRLHHEDINFKQLLDDTRSQLAVSYLQKSHLNLTNISELLGFSETSGFNRAFKRWKGISPKKWQNQNIL